MKHRARKKGRSHPKGHRHSRKAIERDKKLHQFGYLFTHRYYVSD